MSLLLRYWAVPVLLGLQILFWQVPAIDLLVSGWFWEGEQGFYLRDLAPVRWSYALFRDLPYVAVPALVWLYVASWWWRRGSEARLRRRLLFLFLVMGIGPGLLVNEVFKAESGRARPATVEAFGGERQFTPAFEPADQCVTNCSFVSGHAAMGYWFLAFAWLFGDRRWLWWGGAVGLLVGLGRVIQGAHFLSDVLFGYPVVLISALVLSRLLLGTWWPSATPQPRR